MAKGKKTIEKVLQSKEKKGRDLEVDRWKWLDLKLEVGDTSWLHRSSVVLLRDLMKMDFIDDLLVA